MVLALLTVILVVEPALAGASFDIEFKHYKLADELTFYKPSINSPQEIVRKPDEGFIWLKVYISARNKCKQASLLFDKNKPYAVSPEGYRYRMNTIFIRDYAVPHEVAVDDPGPIRRTYKPKQKRKGYIYFEIKDDEELKNIEYWQVEWDGTIELSELEGKDI